MGHFPLTISHPWLWLLALGLLFWLIHKAKRFSWFFALLVMPGTFAHELAHWLVALLTNGRPNAFSIWPKRTAQGFVLGTVSIAHQAWYNVFFIGVAPLGLLPLAYYGFLWAQRQYLLLGWPALLCLYLVANLAYGAWPSRQDWRMAAKSPLGWGLLVAGAWYAWVKWGRSFA